MLTKHKLKILAVFLQSKYTTTAVYSIANEVLNISN